jgi:divalent metal cation (Fe/Co/Zn/Cd) transporter
VTDRVLTRSAIADRGTRLEYFTIGWNSLEGLVAVISGAISGSVALVGFGIDSFIEVTSGATLLWMMSVDADERSRDKNERLGLRIVGGCFIALAVYVTYEAVSDLVGRKAPEHSIPGIVLACTSLVVMPILSRAKKRVGRQLGSAAMSADAKQTDF